MERKHSLSSSSSPPGKKYDVFLSFRGEDTRYNFTGHLSHSLRKIGLFNIFMDDCALGQGKDIDLELMKAIEDSQYAVVVLSKNYATSSWCLKELAQIVKCMGEPVSGRIRTIFYHVDPFHVRNVKSSEVKKQKESSFWKALEEHAKNPSHSKDLESWRDALFKIANQSGHHVKADMDETSFIENFVADISRELGASIRTTDGLFGMTSRLLALDSYVLEYSAANNVCFIGIHGMGGIGKSTLAGAYYMKMSHKFEGSSFLGNVRFFCDKVVNGLVDLQKQLLKDILGEDLAVGHEINGKALIKNRLHAKKVLIILDDVNKPEQLDALADSHTWFCPGSVIIVTTRDKTFKRIEPPEEFKKLSTEVVEYAAKLPLALTVLGSLFGRKKKSLWEDVLCRLRQCPDKNIDEILKISYYDLDEADQFIFLDIACFFNGIHENEFIEIQDSCGFHSNLGISNLIDKSLLSIKQYGQIWMHDLLQEMGKGIVRKNSGNELQRQSRIWNEVDLNQILEKKEGTNEVEAIVTDVHEVCRFEALSSVKKLRLLWINAEGLLLEQKSERMNMEEFGYDGPYDLDELYDCDGPELSNNLQYLEWSGFPYNKLPSSFQPRNLVQMKLRRANIKQLWNNCIEDSERRYQDFRFVVPHSDDELPSWFINQSLAASINIKLDPNWCSSSELIGFAVVFCFRANSSLKIISLAIYAYAAVKETKFGYWKSPREKCRITFIYYIALVNTAVRVQNSSNHQAATPLSFHFLVQMMMKIARVDPVVFVGISHLSKLRHMSPIGSLWTGLKGTLDLVDNLELVEMHRYPDEDPPNPGSNPSMVGNTHFGVFRDYSGITTKFLDK
ncbi:hypothetical protein FNV43_RR08845 [Rhamnella rubrinervis]|uniref:ADP-ribosyl cyclase/cyclic ADP-ribose hydrolase n=1 Tax=Rhamnella rubrinervis TaxID=2594499 RepID=A0A8K0H9J2_9ROSA|nr:hypothetical protein FNV43_RR08845 [Rhamnella rubrinervis]